jgi:hypothetical protein
MIMALGALAVFHSAPEQKTGANPFPPSRSVFKSGTDDSYDVSGEKVICRAIKDPQWRTSSQRVCMTKAQWDRDERERRDDMEAVNRGGGDKRPY